MKKTGPKRIPLEIRFWRFVAVGKKSECWEWRGYTAPKKGRGQIHDYIGNKIILMPPARASYLIHKGKIPKKMCVCHSCDNPICVNPHHLWLGSNSENLRDMVRKGRYVAWDKRGEKNPRAKLTWKNVTHIRCIYPIISAINLAKKYDVSRNLIHKIIAKEIWK